MNNELGEAVVKITGDIKPLEQAVSKAQQVAGSLKNFKINYNGFDKTLTDSEEDIKKRNALLEEARQIGEARLLAIRQENQELTKTPTVLESIKERAENVGDAIQGSLLRVNDGIEEAGRRGRTILIGLATAIGAYGKSALSEYAKYNENFAETQEKLSESVSKIKASIGQLLSPIVGVISNVAEWASKNQGLVSGLFTFVSVLAGSAGLIALVKKLSSAFVALKATAGGVVGIISALAGLLVGVVSSTQSYDYTLNDTAESEEKLREATENLNQAYDSYQDTLSDVNKQISDLRKQIDEATEDYKDNLKKILSSHEDTVERLTQQIKDANADYQRAVDERTASFKVSQLKEEEEHQNKVDELMTQIDFLQRYNNKYNQEKLSQLQFELAKENRQYQEQTKAREEELNIQLRTEREKNEARIAEYQSELNEELSLLNKHRDLLNSVRDRIVLDEVESLTKQYNKQVASYNEQISLAMESGRKAGLEYAKAYNRAYTEENAKYVEEYRNLQSQAERKFGSSGSGTIHGKNGLNITQYTGADGKVYRTISAEYADGGFTGQGGKNEVAGIVHKGEYVIPKEQVNQATGQPKGIGGVTVNISMNGAFATSATERRKFAEEIRNEFNKIDFARLGA